MEPKYTYLFRNAGATELSSYFVPLKMKPVSLMYILKMLARTNSSLRRFQIGIQTEQDGVKKIHWNPTIYNVCENEVAACAVTKGDVALDKNFMPIYGARQTPIQIIKQIIYTEKIMR